MQSVNIPGFEGQLFSVKIGKLFGNSQLLLDGKPAPAGAKRGQYRLRRNDGSEAVAHFKFTFPDPMPLLVVDGEGIQLAKPLAWYEWVWAAFPISLIFMGGLIGAIFGLGAVSTNAQIFRSDRSTVMKYVLSGLMSVVTLFLCTSLVVTLKSMIGNR
jgi:hypothetical protein